MKSLAITLIAASVASLALVGCGKDAGTAVGTNSASPKVEKFPEGTTVADLFPTVVGSQSTFEATGSDEDVSLKVTDVKDQGDAKVVTIEVLSNESVTDKVVWTVGPKGITQLSARSGQSYNPPQLAVAPDLKSQAEIKYTGTGPFPSVETGQPTTGKLEGIMRNRGIETVDTEMGQIEALAVESVYGYTAGGKQYRAQITSWFAPKYGIVRLVQIVQREDMQQPNTTTLKLKSFRTK